MAAFTATNQECLINCTVYHEGKNKHASGMRVSGVEFNDKSDKRKLLYKLLHI